MTQEESEAGREIWEKGGGLDHLTDRGRQQETVLHYLCEKWIVFASTSSHTVNSHALKTYDLTGIL